MNDRRVVLGTLDAVAALAAGVVWWVGRPGGGGTDETASGRRLS